MKNWRLRYRESSEWINSSSWKARAWNWKQQTQKKIPGCSFRQSKQWLERSSHVCNVPNQRMPKIWMKLHKAQTGGKGIAKTCTTIKKGKESNENIGSKSLHHFIQRLIVPQVRQQVAKPHVLIRSQQNCGEEWYQITKQRLDQVAGNCLLVWRQSHLHTGWRQPWCVDGFLVSA